MQIVTYDLTQRGAAIKELLLLSCDKASNIHEEMAAKITSPTPSSPLQHKWDSRSTALVLAQASAYRSAFIHLANLYIFDFI